MCIKIQDGKNFLSPTPIRFIVHNPTGYYFLVYPYVEVYNPTLKQVSHVNDVAAASLCVCVCVCCYLGLFWLLLTWNSIASALLVNQVLCMVKLPILHTAILAVYNWSGSWPKSTIQLTFMTSLMFSRKHSGNLNYTANPQAWNLAVLLFPQLTKLFCSDLWDQYRKSSERDVRIPDVLLKHRELVLDNNGAS